MKVLPANILKCMPKVARVPLGKAGLTSAEAEAKHEQVAEKKIQDDMEQFCLRHNLFYLRMPMHRATRIRAGWPDFLIILPHQRALLIEVKTADGRTSQEQDALHLDYNQKTGDTVKVVRSYLQFITLIGEETKHT